MNYDDEPQSAMLLTEQEWQDLATLVSHAAMCCNGPACDHRAGAEAQRLRILAGRIIEASN